MGLADRLTRLERATRPSFRHFEIDLEIIPPVDERPPDWSPRLTGDVVDITPVDAARYLASVRHEGDEQP